MKAIRRRRRRARHLENSRENKEDISRETCQATHSDISFPWSLFVVKFLSFLCLLILFVYVCAVLLLPRLGVSESNTPQEVSRVFTFVVSWWTWNFCFSLFRCYISCVCVWVTNVTVLQREQQQQQQDGPSRLLPFSRSVMKLSLI